MDIYAISRFAIIKEIASVKGKKICILAILHKVHSDKKWDLFEPATTNHQRFTLNQNETYLSSLSKTQSNIIHRKKLKSLGLECPLIIL